MSSESRRLTGIPKPSSGSRIQPPSRMSLGGQPSSITPASSAVAPSSGRSSLGSQSTLKRSSGSLTRLPRAGSSSSASIAEEITTEGATATAATKEPPVSSTVQLEEEPLSGVSMPLVSMDVDMPIEVAETGVAEELLEAESFPESQPIVADVQQQRRQSVAVALLPPTVTDEADTALRFAQVSQSVLPFL